jgi:hypothetical protein
LKLFAFALKSLCQVSLVCEGFQQLTPTEPKINLKNPQAHLARPAADQIAQQA